MLTSKGSKGFGLRDLVLFVERANELWQVARLRCWSIGAGAKASLNRAHELFAVDPKPGDLSMCRLKRE